MEHLLEHPDGRRSGSVVFFDNGSVDLRNGKEGVDGSSPSEGSAKAPHVGAFFVAFGSTCRWLSARWIWSRLWRFQIQMNGRSARRRALLRDCLRAQGTRCSLERLGVAWIVKNSISRS